ncbi:ubiquitination pathway protein [Scheffersomyces xylosifermentans]|uniref:ubiquitination pathway protein n=1 Tax=Scheffersomyces xylosifermentans TaxID=1304137 RepID=UPI00315DFAE7
MSDRNRYSLKLSSLSIRRKGTTNNQDEDDNDKLINILPSYQMYQSTISKQLTPSREDLRTEPPSYELTPQSSTVSTASSTTNDYFAGVSMPTSPVDEGMEHQLQEGDSTETILENAHKLKRLTSINKEIAKSLTIEIFVTESIGEVGVKPKILDPLSLEIKQGDYIYGFVLVTNHTEHDVPFDMFSVVLEGCATFGSSSSTVVQPPSTIIRFLTMFDFNASWNDAFLDRLVTDHNNPRIPCRQVDPVDGTQVQLDERKIFEPNVTYKKYFTFRMPQKLLDCSCEHGFVKHLQLPPTLGIPKNEIITCLRQKWKNGKSEIEKSDDPTKLKERYASLTNDFFFPDASIDFSISARIIGRASDYAKVLLNSPVSNSHGDEYVVANEDYCYLRFIPASHSLFELNRAMINEEAKLISVNMIQKIKEKINLGRELSSIPVEERNLISPALQPSPSATDLAKMQQSYYAKVRPTNYHVNRDNIYEVLFPFKKKAVFGATKVIGLGAFSTPKKEYRVNYNPFPKYRKEGSSPLTNVTIPIELTYLSSDRTSKYIPDFKKISVELIALTIKSKKLPIPLVFHPDMLFENKGKTNDNFDMVTVRIFQKYAIELSKSLKELGNDALEVDKRMVFDLKCMANLSTKYDHLKVPDVSLSREDSDSTYQLISSIPWHSESVSNGTHSASEVQVKHFKKFNLNVDFSSAIYGPTLSHDFCLVPDFQSCYLARLYYLKLHLKCPNGEKVYMRIPIVLQRDG